MIDTQNNERNNDVDENNASSFDGYVDRIEESMAVVYVADRYKLNLPLTLLPRGITEGEHLNISVAKDSSSEDDPCDVLTLWEETRK